MGQVMGKNHFTTIGLTGLILALMLVSVSCQQGKKEDGQSQVYSDVLDKCDLIEKQLEKENVILKNTPAKPSELGDKLEFSLTTTPQENKVQSLLEQYVVISQKLLDVGDTQVVVFPEKDRLQKSLNNALIYLGYLYAKSEGHGPARPIQDKNLDYAELSYRFARFEIFIKTLKELKIPTENISETNKIMLTLKNDELEKIVSMSTVITTDIFTIRRLVEKNKNLFIGAGLDSFTSEESTLSLSGMTWNYREQAKSILKSRETVKAEAQGTP